MHSAVRERVLFQMTGGCCLHFASQFTHLLCYHGGTRQTLQSGAAGSAAGSSAQAARRAREDAGLVARPVQQGCAGRAGAGEAAQPQWLFLLWRAKSKDVQHAG